MSDVPTGLDAERAEALSTALVAWYGQHHRELPWREDPSPYRVWVSEIMLQQTRVATVVPYFDRWMRRFPDVASLAAASLDEVLSVWSGLGYYRRARMLHAAANVVVDEHGGRLPSTAAELRALPGIGRYTAGAIASTAFGQPEPIVDGNVIRLLARHFGIDSPARRGAAQRRFWALARQLVETSEDPSVLNQGLMELGALVCTPKATPACLLCPWRGSCVAHREGRQDELPVLDKKRPLRAMHLVAAVVVDDHGHYFVSRRPEAGLFGGLWEHPTVPWDPSETEADRVLQKLLDAEDIEAKSIVPLSDVGQTLSHIALTVRPFLVKVNTVSVDAPLDRQWLSREGLAELGQPSWMRQLDGHR